MVNPFKWLYHQYILWKIRRNARKFNEALIEIQKQMIEAEQKLQKIVLIQTEIHRHNQIKKEVDDVLKDINRKKDQ